MQITMKGTQQAKSVAMIIDILRFILLFLCETCRLPGPLVRLFDDLKETNPMRQYEIEIKIKQTKLKMRVAHTKRR